VTRFLNSPGDGLLKVLDLNTWGLSWPIAVDKSERFRALREVILHSDYDIVVLQEVWFR
jgi:endonuclease/exonuclease/phosphatase family metal-dependent hydrolase